MTLVEQIESENMSDIPMEKFNDIIEFVIIIVVASLINVAVYNSLVDASADPLTSTVAGWVVFGFVVLAYYGKIRAYVRVNR